ncbi:unnamed protein product [Heterobilharzia americana]|nr:unnamed protein product [Heterobilharzia americana]
MERKITTSISDRELVPDERVVDIISNNSTNSKDKLYLIEHTHSLPNERSTDLYSNSSNNNNYNNKNSRLQRGRTLSYRPRMVARSSVNCKHLSGNIFANNRNTPNYLSDQRLFKLSPTPSEAVTPQPVQNTHTDINSNNITIGNITDNQTFDYMSFHSDRPLSTSALRLPSNTMDHQMMTSPMSPEIMSASPREPRIDDLLIKKGNRTARYLDNTKNIRRESKSYSTTISPIPLISYHQNAIPGGIDLYPTTLEKISTPDKKSYNDELSTHRKKMNKGDLSRPTVITKARVELVLIFVKVGQVDTVNERYQADIFLQARWREPLLDAIWNKPNQKSKSGWQTNHTIENPMTDLTPKRHLNTLKLQDDEFWNPRLLIDNAQGEPIEIVSHEVEFVEPHFEAYLVEKRRIKGVFHETLELRHFPFDCQDLSVTITCDRTIDEVELVASPTEVSQVDVRCAEDSQEWKIFHHVDIKSMEIQTGYSPGTSKRRHPGLVFTSRSARRSGYFMVNMVLISCVLCLLSFSAFSVPANENRLQLSLLLLLTTVTFKFAASQNLPKISYLTYLDKVVLVNFFMLVILTVWHAIARAVSASRPNFLEYEHYVMYSLLSCYCLGSVLFGLTVYLDLIY